MAALALALPAAPAMAVRSAGGYRLVGRPIVVVHRSDDGTPYYETFVRLNRGVPRRATNGSPLAGATLDGFGPDLDFARAGESAGGFVTATRKRRRHCYMQSTLDVTGPQPPALARPREGRLVHVEVHIDGVAALLTAGARLTTSARQAPAAALGC